MQSKMVQNKEILNISIYSKRINWFLILEQLSLLKIMCLFNPWTANDLQQRKRHRHKCELDEWCWLSDMFGSDYAELMVRQTVPFLRSGDAFKWSFFSTLFDIYCFAQSRSKSKYFSERINITSSSFLDSSAFDKLSKVF